MKNSGKNKLDRIINDNVRLLRELMKELARIEEEKKLALSRVRN